MHYTYTCKSNIWIMELIFETFKGSHDPFKNSKSEKYSYNGAL